MKKDTGVFRISEKQELAVRALCAQYSISRSQLFRNVILWAITNQMPISKQSGVIRFASADRKNDSQKSSYLFGSKLSPDILLKINNLCKLNGVQESHLYRCFLDEYIKAHTGRARPRLVMDRPYSPHTKPVANQNYIIPSFLFSKPNFTYNFPKPDTSTLLGRIQASNIEAIEMSQNLSNAVGLAVVLISTFSRK
jgi:hypothetical protein